MKEESIKAFLEQFSTSKRNVDGWPNWMQDSAKVASASLPKTHHQTPTESTQREVSNLKKTDERS
jgi:hypothetical protein